MKKLHLTASVSCLVFLGIISTSTGVSAQDVTLRHKESIKAQYVYNDHDDLGTANVDSRDSQLIEAKLSLFGDIYDDFSYYTEMRGVKNYGDAGSVDTDTGEALGQQDFLELRQYWLEYKNIAGISPLSLRVGRQRIREERSLWWNRDQDAVRLIYDATLVNGFLAVGQNLTEYRTGDGAFDNDDEDILRVLGQASWQWKPDHVIEARFAYQDDHSGTASIGTIIQDDNRDDDDADLLWIGARAKGLVAVDSVPAIGNIAYRADIIGLTGSEDVTASSNNGDGTRTVTGTTNQDVSGWAVDFGVDVPVQTQYLNPIVSLGYAYGSGDDDLTDNDDTNFRQTGLDGNTSRARGVSGTTDNYGAVLRPDLSNMHIFTAGLTIPVFKNSDVYTKYHYYRLAEDATSLVSSGISAPLNGTDKDVGHGLDVIFNLDVSKEFDLTHDMADNIDLKTTLGAFKAGSAYGAAEDETAFRGQIDFKISF